MKFKLGTLATALLLAAGTASAGTVISSDNGQFSISGNVEIDNDYVDIGDSESYYRKGGRVQLQADAYKALGDKYVQARGQALLGSDGNTSTDDAWLEFGQQDGLSLRVGSFEAMDVYPLGQDIIVDFARDTLSPFDAVYIYRANELRGRARNGFGQIMLASPVGENVRLELSSLLGTNANFLTKYQLDNFTGGELVAEDGDAVGLRPGIEYRTEQFRLAAVMEINLNNGTINEFAAGDDPATAAPIDTVSLNDRLGAGVSGSYYGNGYTVNANLGYLDAKEVEAYSVGLNTVIADFGLGYVYAKNDNTTGVDPYSQTVYASYAWNNLMEVEDLAMKVGAFYSHAEDLNGSDHSENKGARLRFFYSF